MTRVRCRFGDGDLLGFSGVGLQSRIIQASTFSWIRRINHVAMVRVRDGAGREVWESTTGLDVPCSRLGRIVHGVQCHALAERLEHARKSRDLVWHYRLGEPLDPEASRRLDSVLLEDLGKPYDYAGAVWARSCAFGWLAHRLKNREATGSVFCSEGGARWTRAMGVFNCRNASMWNPAFLLRTLQYLGVVAAPRLIVEGRPAA